MEQTTLNQEFEQCEKCGSLLKEQSGLYTCTKCNQKYRVAFSAYFGKYLEEVNQEPNKNKKKIVIGVVIACLVVVLLFAISSCGSDFFKPKLIRIIEKNGLAGRIDTATVTEIVQAEVPANGSALPQGYSVILLCHRENPEYEIALVNYSEETMELFEYTGMDPLQTIHEEYIVNLPEAKQIEHFTCISGYIIKYGPDCLQDRAVAKMYIKQAAPFYDIGQVKESLKWDAAYTLQNRQESKDFKDIKVIFDGQSAIPLYYTTMKTSLVPNPNWGYVDIDSLNAIQLDFFYNLWGPILIEEETWYAYDEYLQKVPLNAPTYQQLEKELLKLHAAKSGK